MQRPTTFKLIALGLFGMALLGSGCAFRWPWSGPTQQEPAISTPTDGGSTTQQQVTDNNTALFGASVKYQAPTSVINPDIAKDFDIATIKNIADMEKAYGVTFSASDLNTLKQNKFIVKNLLDTAIRPSSSGDNVREFVQLYNQVTGPFDPHERAPQNAAFYSSDVFFNTYNNIYTELLKEMENKTFYPSMLALSDKFYHDASGKLATAQTEDAKQTWTKVRNYFAVPYAIFSTAAQPLSSSSYYDGSGNPINPTNVQADFATNDAKVDTLENATSFIAKLKLDPASERAILADLKQIYDPKQAATPSVFTQEYSAYLSKTGVDFKVDFTQFTPRGSYTSSSLRREYFRGMKWYIMVPFFIKSPELTTYAFAATQLMSENPASLQDYNKLESAIEFLVGSTDDLMPADYLLALESAKNAPDQTAAIADYLAKAHPPMIKDLAASYQEVGVEKSDEVLLNTKGMRFFGGKFIMDSYWTGQLTQGDEAVKPGYPQKLPPMASSLEVMTILGSDYAKSQIPKLDFYTPKYSQAVDKAVADLSAQTAQLTDADWTKNLYTGWLWTIKSLFSWLQTNHAVLPQFMQSVAWEAKTLQTAAGFWTELRHATILYAKQSFAELGAGPPGCDPREIPQPPKSYIEPQSEAYARLSYLAKRTEAGLKEQGFQLNNFGPLENFIQLMDKVQMYVDKELGNTTLNEHISKSTEPDVYDETKTCTSYAVDESDWEALRIGIVRGLESSIPAPTEGPILQAKDRRAALIADVHTGQDSNNPMKILYEAEGVPYVIFTAVSDANGPRLTVGFTYSQYEFTKEYGGPRMTDEDWQKNFYVGSDPYEAYFYTDKATWPAVNPWYAPIFGTVK
jgi:hypothetical protein